MTQPDDGAQTMIATKMSTFPPDDPIIIVGCVRPRYREEFRFVGKGFFGRIHAAILNWLRRNSN